GVGEESDRAAKPVLNGFLGSPNLVLQLPLRQVGQEGVGSAVRPDLHSASQEARRLVPAHQRAGGIAMPRVPGVAPSHPLANQQEGGPETESFNNRQGW